MFSDAREKLRQETHAALREACGVAEDVSAVRRLLGGLPETDVELVVNMAPGGANTLLFVACQTGRREMVRALLEAGADGRCHTVTRYSPLYIACYHGHQAVAELLLQKFPELAQLHTVERWLPIHACCINGHVHLLETLLRHSYPSRVLREYRTACGQRYRAPFDINELDVTGQSVLYVACLLGNARTVETILSYRVKTLPEENTDGEEGNTTPQTEEPPQDEQAMSPTRRRISYGIQTIMSKLSLSRGGSAESDTSDSGQSPSICPVMLDQYCNNGTETALHAAVKVI